MFQPLRLDIKRKLSARSDRVKSVDLHPSEPWMLASLYNGNVHIWNHESQVSFQFLSTLKVLHFKMYILLTEVCPHCCDPQLILLVMCHCV